MRNFRKRCRGTVLQQTSELNYYFHCTSSPELRKQCRETLRVTMQPRIAGDYRPLLEPQIARICVCPTISGCLVASNYNDVIVVLRTVRKVAAWNVFDVDDSHITGEKWLLTPTDFKVVAAFSREEISIEDNSSCWGTDSQAKGMISNREALRNAEKFKDLQEFI